MIADSIVGISSKCSKYIIRNKLLPFVFAYLGLCNHKNYWKTFFLHWCWFKLECKLFL